MEDAHAGPAGSPSKGSVGEEALSPPAPGSLASSKTSTAGAKGDTTGQAAGGPSAACELAQGAL